MRINSLRLGLIVFGVSVLVYGCMAQDASTETGAAGTTGSELLTEVHLVPIGSYSSGIFNGGASEIGAHDPDTQRVFVTNVANATVDVLDISDPTHPTFAFAIGLTPYGALPNSVAMSPREHAIAVAIENTNRQEPGVVAFFDTDGHFLRSVTVGAVPDMVTFTPDGRKVLVANEGEPNDSYTIDPEGSVSVIDVSGGIASLTQSKVRTADFRRYNTATLPSSMRVFGPNATVAQDVEPEYIAVGPDSNYAWVTLQENNAVAVIDLRLAKVIDLIGLGFKNHNLAENAIDASDQDGAIHIAPWPVSGMYLPDSIKVVTFLGIPYIVMANEGDSRAYTGFNEEARISSVTLDPTKFPNAVDLKKNTNIGRLRITNTMGDDDGDGDFDRLFSFGARSFSVLTGWGTRVFDSKDQIEAITAQAFPADFNSNNDANHSFDTRSDDKGPEPEGLEVGRVLVSGNPSFCRRYPQSSYCQYRTLAFTGLERIGGVMTYDVTKPWAPKFLDYANRRDFSQTSPALIGDLGPEGLHFIAADESPNDKPLVLVTNEISGTTTLYEVQVD